jgi:hypothetical protein
MSVRGLKNRTRAPDCDEIEAISLPLIAVAEGASIGQIISFGCPAMLNADDVVNLASKERIFFSYQAIIHRDDLRLQQQASEALRLPD